MKQVPLLLLRCSTWNDKPIYFGAGPSFGNMIGYQNSAQTIIRLSHGPLHWEFRTGVTLGISAIISITPHPYSNSLAITTLRQSIMIWTVMHSKLNFSPPHGTLVWFINVSTTGAQGGPLPLQSTIRHFTHWAAVRHFTHWAAARHLNCLQDAWSPKDHWLSIMVYWDPFVPHNNQDNTSCNNLTFLPQIKPRAPVESPQGWF